MITEDLFGIDGPPSFQDSVLLVLAFLCLLVSMPAEAAWRLIEFWVPMDNAFPDPQDPTMPGSWDDPATWLSYKQAAGN